LTLLGELIAFHQILKRYLSRSAAGALIALAAAIGFTSVTSVTARAEAPAGIGLSILYDTSGSMREPVKDLSGKSAAKYEIANRAFTDVVDRLVIFHKANPDRTVSVGLFIFGEETAREVVPFGEFDPERLRAWIKGFSTPTGATPLGTSMRAAARPLLAANLKHRHLLVVTDGENNIGPDPATVVSLLRGEVAKRGLALGIHVIAFDVNAKIFDPLKKLDVTIASATNEKQLDAQISAILEQKILLEDEEPAAKRP
jgi:von Willebrand factor type A domain